MEGQLCFSRRSTRPPGHTAEAEPPEKQLLPAPRWDDPEEPPAEVYHCPRIPLPASSAHLKSPILVLPPEFG
uniref:Uncharacterized protein n=1 Tax=Oryctolagus cuniculus TaxID=9986 RepID=A0A5F9DH55_RABIT